MAIIDQINPNSSGVAYHIVDGLTQFPYAVDAQSAVGRFPGEWSFEPWPPADMQAAREKAGAPALELSPEEQAAIDEHAKLVAEANERLAKRREELAEQKRIADEIAADEALVKSPPPMPDPNRPRRPFGRPGEPTPAELEQIKKREAAQAAKKADDERIAREKANADAQAAANVKVTG